MSDSLRRRRDGPPSFARLDRLAVLPTESRQAFVRFCEAAADALVVRGVDATVLLVRLPGQSGEGR
jgi:hypothetical protein